MLFTIRKFLTVVEEIHHDHGPAPDRPALKGAVAAVITNPYVGHYVEDLSPVGDDFKALGQRMGDMLIRQLGGDGSAIDGYGKGIIVGAAGEVEHGAMWHIPGGAGMRAALGKGTAIVPSTKKVAGMGARLDVPITHLAAAGCTPVWRADSPWRTAGSPGCRRECADTDHLHRDRPDGLAHRRTPVGRGPRGDRR